VRSGGTSWHLLTVAFFVATILSEGRRSINPSLSRHVVQSHWVAYNPNVSRPLVIFLHGAAYDRVYQAVNMIATASSLGRECRLFLFYHALGSFMAGEWDAPPAASGAAGLPAWEATLERNLELSNTPSLYDMLDRARREPGRVTVFACSNSVQLLGLEPAVVKRRVDEIIGLATMLDLCGGDCQVFYI
jgi:peroxiredoxin family protein